MSFVQFGSSLNVGQVYPILFSGQENIASMKRLKPNVTTDRLLK